MGREGPEGMGIESGPEEEELRAGDRVEERERRN